MVGYSISPIIFGKICKLKLTLMEQNGMPVKRPEITDLNNLHQPLAKIHHRLHHTIMVTGHQFKCLVCVRKIKPVGRH